MSNIKLWEPMREMMTLREAMDRLFDDAFTRPISNGTALSMPAIDMYQTNDAVIVKASLPGMKADDVQISITGDTLTLRGETKYSDVEKDVTYHIREQRIGSFERAMLLPTLVQTDKCKADFESGVLTITLPKAESAKPKTISIKAK